MSTQQQDVFRDCFRLAKQLEEAVRFREGASVLRSLAQYLDVSPSMPDKSDKKMIDRYLILVLAKIKVGT